jgi:hypothetical protein
VTDVGTAGDVAHRLAVIAPPYSLPLVRGEFRLASRLHVVRHGAGEALARGIFGQNRIAPLGFAFEFDLQHFNDPLDHFQFVEKRMNTGDA